MLYKWPAFLSAARKRFDDSPLFRNGIQLSEFVNNVLKYTLEGNKEVPGLFTVRQLLQYSSASWLRNLPDPSVGMEWNPVDKEAALNAFILCRNLGFACGNAEGQPKECSIFYHAFNSNPDDFFANFSKCKAQNVLPSEMDLNLKILANFLGDGAIDREVDMDGKGLEGYNTTYTACFLAQLFDRLGSNPKLLDLGKINPDDLLRDKKLLVQAAATEQLIQDCAEEAKNGWNPQEVFETAVLEQLRGLQEGSQILMSTGFTKHAMAMSIKRISPSHYELLVFNSGSGLRYHMSHVKGSKSKVFPVKRFINMSLMDLKWSQVLQRIYQVDAIGSEAIVDPETKRQSETSAQDFYLMALAGLSQFEHHFNEDDMKLFRWFTGQRSGVCSVEVIKAFFAYDKQRPYQQLKLFVYKDLIDLAFRKQWPEKELPVANRQLKYGVENHVRAVLRFDTRENAELKIPMHDLLPDDLWPNYNRVKDLYVPSRMTAFKADVMGAVPWQVFSQSEMDAAKEVAAVFEKVLRLDRKVEYSPEAACSTYHRLIFGSEMTRNNFKDYLEAVPSYMAKCRLKTDEYETMMFLAFNVMHQWPNPDADVWKGILGKDNYDHGETLAALWSFAQRMLQAQKASGSSNLHVYAALHKIMMIYQYALAQSLPGLVDCDTSPPFYLAHSAYLCISHDVAAYFGKFSLTNRKLCFAGNSPHTILKEALEEIAHRHGADYPQYSGENRLLAILRQTRNKNAPLALHYWSVLRNIINTLEHGENDGWNRYFPKLCDPKKYSPLQDFQTSDELKYGISHDFSLLNSFSKKVPEVFTLSRLMKDQEESSRLQTDPRTKPYWTILQTPYDQLGSFSHLLHLIPEKFDWTMTFHLGAMLVHRPCPKATTEEAIKNIAQQIDILNAELSQNAAYLQGSPNSSPEMKRKCEVFAALIIIESIISQQLQADKVLGGHRHELFKFLNFSNLHVSYKALFVFSYLASVPKEMSLEEAGRIIQLNKSFQATLKRHLPDPDDYQRYRDHILANVMKAFCHLAKQNDPSLSNLWFGAEDGSPQNYGFISTTQQTDNGHFFDLISGSDFTSSMQIIPTDLNQHYDKAAIRENLSDFKFRSIRHKLIGTEQLITCEIFKGSRKLKKDKLVYDLVKLEILVRESGKCYIREGYEVSGEDEVKMEYACRWPSHEYVMDRIPIPAPVDLDNPYKVLIFTETQELAFLGSDQEIWTHYLTKQVTFEDTKLKELEHLYILYSENFASPLAVKDETLFYRSNEDGSHRLLFRNYADANGKPLWFAASHDDASKWDLLSDRKWHIAQNQDFSTAGMLTKYLLLEDDTRTAYKVIVPIEHYQLKDEFGYGKIWDGKYDKVRKRTLTISLTHSAKNHDEDHYWNKLAAEGDAKNKNIPVPALIPHPKSRLESLLLLYNYLVTRHYHHAMKEVDGIHQMEPFDEEEFRLLGWIVDSHQSTKNGSPESIAIRSFICFHVFNNEMLFHPLAAKNKGDDESTNSSQHLPYMSGYEWKSYWGKLQHGIAANSIAAYLDRLTKIPRFLRFDPAAKGFGRIGPVEWISWLKQIVEYFKKSSTSVPRQISLYLWPREEAKILPGLVGSDKKPSTITVNDVDEKLRNEAKLFKTLPNISFVMPSILLKEKDRLLASIIKGTLSTESREKLDQLLIPFEIEGVFTVDAAGLRKALSISKMQMSSEWSKYSQNSDERKKFVKQFVDMFSESKAASKSKSDEIVNERNDVNYDFNEESYKSDLNSENVPDNIFGVHLPLGEIKQRLLESSKSDFKSKNVPDNIFKTHPPLGTSKQHLFEDKELDYLFETLISKVEQADVFKERQINLSQLFKKMTEMDQKLKFIQRLLKLQELQLFKLMVSLNKKNETIERKGLETLAHGQVTVTTADIIHMYAKAQTNYYRRYFPHFDGDCQPLHNLATDFVLAHSNWQEIKRLREAYKNRNDEPKRFEQETQERTRFTDTTKNNMLAYECYINSRLTQKQRDDIIKLTKLDDITGKYPDMFVQWIMSAGKTYILGTLLSVMKADHEHLSILVVPKALLTGEASNLFSRTIAAFNREGFSFQLARDSNLADLKTIKWITESISSAIKRGKYVITSSDMLEGLHDKFVELGKSDYSLAEYDAIKELLGLILDHGAMTVDEAHKIFDPTQETNFPIASSKAAADDGPSTLGLEARVLSEVFQRLVEDGTLLKLMDNKKIAQNIPLDIDTKTICHIIGRHLAETMKNDLRSVLSFLERQDLNTLDSITEQELTNFFTTESEKINASQIDKIQREASPNLYRALGVCRLAVTSLIPLAWSGNVNENYGLEPGKKYSIPFSGAFAPKIGSEFAFRWYCYARTIRTYLVTGFDEVTIRWALVWLQKWALKEMSKSAPGKRSMPEMLIQKLFHLESPFDLDVDSEAQIKNILQRCTEYHKGFVDSAHDESHYWYSLLLFQWIAEDVIPSVKFYPQQISTNSQDISYMVNSRQLYSGSVVSVQTFPRQFLDPKKVDLDYSVDDQIRTAIRKNTIEICLVPDGLSASDFVRNDKIAAISSHVQNPLVAVLDVGAYFKDQRNEQVAASLLNIRDSVLYFSTDKNKLALVTKGDPNEKLIHTYSAEIIRELVKDERERITFYDQQHNTGVDIFQLVNGSALIIIGTKTTSIDFYQAAMRMRKFLETQSLFIIVPQHVLNAMGKKTLPIIDDILEFLDANLQKAVVNLNTIALSQMIAAVFKEAAYRKLLKGPLEKGLLDLWVKDTTSDIRDLIVPQRYQNYREEIVPRIIDSYVARVGNYFTDEVLVNLRQLAEYTVCKAFGQPGKYPEKCLCNVPGAEGDEISAEGKAALKIVDSKDSDMLAIASVEVEVENEQEIVIVAPFKSSFAQIDWNEQEMPMLDLQDGFDLKKLEKSPGIFPVNDVLDVYTLEESNRRLKLFDDALMMTSGFAQRGTIFGQHRNYIPHCLVLIGKGRKVGQDYVIIVDQEEAGQIGDLLGKRPSNTIFDYGAALVDPVRHTVDTGKASSRELEARLREPKLEALLDEVIFFAGYLRQLASLRSGSLLKIMATFNSATRPECLGPSRNVRPFKTALLNDIIVTEEEAEEAESIFPGQTSLVEYVGISAEDYLHAQKSHCLALYNFLSRNRDRLSIHVNDLQKEVKLYGLFDVMENNTRMPIFESGELLEIMRTALDKFFDDPELGRRFDAQANVMAVVNLLANYRSQFTKAVTTGATQLLRRFPKENPAWLVYRGIFQALYTEFPLDPTDEAIAAAEPWLKDYFDALNKFADPALKDLLIPKNAEPTVLEEKDEDYYFSRKPHFASEPPHWGSGIAENLFMTPDINERSQVRVARPAKKRGLGGRITGFFRNLFRRDRR